MHARIRLRISLRKSRRKFWHLAKFQFSSSIHPHHDHQQQQQSWTCPAVSFFSFSSSASHSIPSLARSLFIVDVRRVSVPHFRFALVEKSKTERTRAERKQLTRKHGDRLHLSDVRFQLWQSARSGTASCRSAEIFERASDPPVFSLAHENTPNQSPVKQVKPPAGKSVRSSPLYAKPVVSSIANLAVGSFIHVLF